jgi:hypothetical protein
MPAAKAKHRRSRFAPPPAHAEEPRLPLWSRPGFLLRRLNQIHYALFFEECRAFNITPVQYGLLTALAIRGQLDQGSLGVELGIDRTNVADVLVRLAARGLVRRVRDPSDRRAKLARSRPRAESSPRACSRRCSARRTGCWRRSRRKSATPS